MTGHPIVVVGGGLAGLTAAATAARAGATVTMLEARGQPGGRARSERRASGGVFNEGPHALYAGLAGWRELSALGIGPRGQRPSPHAWGRWQGRIDRLPGTNLDAIRTRLIGLRAKAELGRLLASPRRALRGDLSGSLADWIDRVARDPGARALLSMVGRTGTYSPDPATIAASAAVPQIIGAITDGVRYLDGGWQQLIDSLRSGAVAAGTVVETDAKAEAITRSGTRWIVHTTDREVVGDAVIIAAGGPAHAARLLADHSASLATHADSAEPALMASLDLHLAQLPISQRRACFALDAPLYFSAHTPTANLATHGEVVHVSWYGAADDTTESTLEDYCDEVQPGWREQVIDRRFGRHLVVAYDVPRAPDGLRGRFGPRVDDCPGVFVAGDWVGANGLLGDAAIASGAEAARLACR